MYTLMYGSTCFYVVKVEDVKRFLELSVLKSSPEVVKEWRSISLLLPDDPANSNDVLTHIPITFPDFGVKW